MSTELAPRKEEDVLAGVLRLRLGGHEHLLPVLTVGKARGWTSKLMAAIGKVELPDMAAYTPEWGSAIANQASDQMVELLNAYDQTQAASGLKTAAVNKRWIEENTRTDELFTAFLEVLRVVFPFVEDPLAMVKELISDHMREQRGQRAVAQLQKVAEEIGQASTSGSYTNGAAQPASPE